MLDGVNELYDGISDKMNGRVKFIYRTDAVAPKE